MWIYICTQIYIYIYILYTSKNQYPPAIDIWIAPAPGPLVSTPPVVRRNAPSRRLTPPGLTDREEVATGMGHPNPPTSGENYIFNVSTRGGIPQSSISVGFFNETFWDTPHLRTPPCDYQEKSREFDLIYTLSRYRSDMN